eukprot:404655-Prymnesium_polylepis.1
MRAPHLRGRGAGGGRQERPSESSIGTAREQRRRRRRRRAGQLGFVWAWGREGVWYRPGVSRRRL